MQFGNRTMCQARKGDMRVQRKLAFIEREPERMADAVDEARMHDDYARDIRDCIVNIEIQVADLQELLCGP